MFFFYLLIQKKSDSESTRNGVEWGKTTAPDWLPFLLDQFDLT